MSQMKKLTVSVLALAAAALVVIAAFEPQQALAASKIGKNVGAEVKSWAAALLVSVAALVGLPALAKTDMKQAGLIAAMVFLLGGFVFAEGTVKSVIETLWRTVA